MTDKGERVTPVKGSNKGAAGKKDEPGGENESEEEFGLGKAGEEGVDNNGEEAN